MSQNIRDIFKVREEGDEAPYPGVYLARVTRSSATSLHFALEDEEEIELGPAPYPRIPEQTKQHDHPDAGLNAATIYDQAVPPRGTKIAVGFVDGDADMPLVLALYGWPA